MSSAVEKTKKIKRKDVAIDLLEANPNNPNEMDSATFNMLYDNMETVGFVDPIMVIPHPEKDGMYRIIGGEHRWEVAKLLEFNKVPVTIVEDEAFDQDMQNFQIVRMNVIKGRMSPAKFVNLVNQISAEYSEEVMAEMFGFVDEEEFKKLIATTKAGLPKEMQKDFEDAKDEIKTIDDLSKVLNRLFTMYGDTLPYGYMLIDYGNKDSIWLRMKSTGYEDFLTIARQATENSIAMDTVMEAILNLIATGTKVPSLEKLLSTLPMVELPEDFDTEDVLVLDYLED